MLSFSAVVHQFYLVVSHFFSVYTWIIHRCKIIGRNPKQQYNSRRCLKYRRFQFFSQIQFSHFGLDFCSQFRWDFLPFRWICSPCQNRQTHAKTANYKYCSGAETIAASNNSTNGNHFTYMRRCRYVSFSLVFSLLAWQTTGGCKKCLEP